MAVQAFAHADAGVLRLRGARCARGEQGKAARKTGLVFTPSRDHVETPRKRISLGARCSPPSSKRQAVADSHRLSPSGCSGP